jgi:endoglucanase
VQALVNWHVKIVHLGLNEDCILGINGVPAQYAGANYLNAIVDYVNLLHANGIYAEISLMWAAPGGQQATGHPKILDQDHSPAALQAIGNAFKNDPQTIIGLQSEPHDISWACWLNGGASCSVGYAALGMQGALNAVRGSGAGNVVSVSGIDWANNLTEFLANRPSDPSGQLVAEQHIYDFNVCGSVSCLQSEVAPVALVLPVIWGEYGQADCGTSTVAGFLAWADLHISAYEAWTWDTWGDCLQLIANYGGTPQGAYGNFVHDYYVSHG